MSKLIKDLDKTFYLFLKSGAQINFLINYDEDIINGFVGTENKLNEIFICKRMNYFEKLNT